MLLNSADTFDTTYALSAMFLWVIFGMLQVIVNCDLQRLMWKYTAVFHAVGLVAFFFLFALIDTANKTSIWVIWIKSIFIYILFVGMTKSKWYFVVPVLSLLLVDQMLKKDLAFRKARDDADAVALERREAVLERVTLIINITIIVVIFLGSAHYAYLQKLEYQEAFSWTKFFGVNKCKTSAPNYTKLIKSQRRTT